MSEELTLSEKIKQNQLANESATAQRNEEKRQQEQQKQQQAQAELDQYNKEVEQYNRDLAEYERQLAEIKLQEERANEPTPLELIEKRKDEQIKELERQRQEAIENIPSTFTTPRRGQDTVKPISRDQRKIAEMQIMRNYQDKIEAVLSEYVKDRQQTQLAEKYPDAQLGRSALNTYKANQGKISLTEVYEQQQAKLEAKRQFQRETDIQTARSNALTEQAKFEQTIRTLEQQKKPDPTFIFNSTPTKAGDLKPKPTPPQKTLFQPPQEPISPNTKAIESFEKQQQEKEKLLQQALSTRITKPIPRLDIQNQTQKESSAFLTKPPQNAKSIIGTSQQRSEQAVYTFEQTQKQQKELYQKLSQAKTSKEAIAIKEQYQSINPYVGTPQTAQTKQGKAEQGVLIEKINLSTKEEIQTSYQTPKEISKTTETQKEITTTQTKDYFGLKDVATGKPLTRKLSTGETVELKFTSEKSALEYIERISKQTETEKQTPSTYGFYDPINDKPIKADSTILWKEANKLIETQIKEPNKFDIEFNQSLREKIKQNPNQEIQIYKDTPTAEPLIQEPLVKGLTDYGTELTVLGEDVISLANPNYERKIKPGEASLETVAFSEGIEQGKYLLNLPESEKQTGSKTLSYVKEKLKTPEGSEYLAGSIIGSGALIGLTSGLGLLKQPLKASVKEVNVLKDIAENIYKPKIQDDFRTARLKELNPELSEAEISKLSKILYPPERTQQEIKLIDMLKQNNPNISQERIDFIISQTQKTDAIKLYQKQQALRNQLKQDYPQMSSKTIEQKVATMTAKETDEIPYSIEKINERSYLISAGRESKETNAPFIVVTFQKQRLGKEIGTYEIYESPKGIIKPTDIIIQGISKTELKGGQVLSKSPSSTITRYPTGKKNIYKVLDPNQKDLALIGTKKTGLLSTLKQYPKETIESMISDERKTAILETKHETELLAKMDKSARMDYDLAIKQGKPAKTTLIIEITKQANKIEITKPARQTIDIGKPTPSKTTQSNIDISPTSNTEKLKDITRATEKQKASDTKVYQNIKSVSSMGLSQAGISSMKINTAQAQRTQTQQSTKQDNITIGQQRDLTIQIPDKLEITKQRDLISERNIIKEKITEKYKQATTPRFSLITIPGLGTGLDQGTRLDIITDLTQVTTQKELEIFKYPTPPEEPFGKTRIPPGGIIIPDLTKKEKEIISLKGKKAKTLYFSWNVNTEEPGRYLPTKELVTGYKPSVLTRTNKIQRQVRQGSYRYKLDKQVTSRLDKTITKEDKTFKPDRKKESFKSKVNKSNLRNLDQSLVKKSKFIKKTKFKF